MVVDDRLPFPIFNPVVPRNPGVVFIHAAIPLLPVENLLTNTKPSGEPLQRYLGQFGPTCDEVDNLVARIMGNPAAR